MNIDIIKGFLCGCHWHFLNTTKQ